MKLIKWEPFSKIDNLFEDFPISTTRFFSWDLAVDVYEEKGNAVAKMNLPGIDPDNIDISIDGNLLYISGEREEEKEENEKEYYSKEIRRGSFSRTIELPSHVNVSKSEANYKEGVLTIVMPEIKEEKESRVKLKINKG
ncbi:MAG: Hsp20/alpha crystallin family protein [Patescibacteria group bacterium]|nr:Hsp20/alpha crystallin family protein [Patescibacteria group bacterium]